MERRQVLRLLAVGGTGATLTLGQGAFSPAVANEGGPAWGYVGAGNPEEWGQLSPEFSACGIGSEQSPINLSDAVKADLGWITINYQTVPLRLINTSHTLQVNVDPGSTISVDGVTYELQQFHFHHPSEHTIDGVPRPMEMHLVHKSPEGGFAVLGVFLVEGIENLTLSPLWAAMPRQKSEEIAVSSGPINLDALIPQDSETYRYAGSLTTPPCAETVYWLVLQTPLEVSPAQIAQFKEIFPLNARPVQPLNRRFLLQSD